MSGRLRFTDGLRVTSVGLRARPLRAALSALGIAIGTAAIVAVLGLSSSSQAGLLAEIDRLGTNMLTLEAGQSVTGQPSIVLADEPTGNLDSATGASIMALIRELNAGGATILMITHDAALADQLPRQIRMLDGQVVSDVEAAA